MVPVALHRPRLRGSDKAAEAVTLQSRQIAGSVRRSGAGGLWREMVQQELGDVVERSRGIR